MVLTLRSGDIAAFLDAAPAVYGPGGMHPVPPRSDLRRTLDKTANPLFSSGDSDLDVFTAHRDGQVVGRITAHMHGASNRTYGLLRAYFGYFDCTEDAEAAQALLKAAEGWARARGLTQIGGNFNLTAMQQIGVLTSGFDLPAVAGQVWSPPHLSRFLTENGYVPGFGMSTYTVDLSTASLPALGPRHQAICDSPAFSFAPILRQTLPQRQDEVREVINAVCASHPMFVPLTAAEFQFRCNGASPLMDPAISVILHHHGQPIGCTLCVPDSAISPRGLRGAASWFLPGNRRGPGKPDKRCHLVFSGVVPNWRGQGIGTILLHRARQALLLAGYRTCAIPVVPDATGPTQAQLARFGAVPLHRLHLFGKQL
jgi:GNAT superfamily N-acetyltransferase